MNEQQKIYHAERAKKKPLGVMIGSTDPEANKAKIAAKPRGTGRIKPAVGQVWKSVETSDMTTIVAIRPGFVEFRMSGIGYLCPLWNWHNDFIYQEDLDNETI